MPTATCTSKQNPLDEADCWGPHEIRSEQNQPCGDTPHCSICARSPTHSYVNRPNSTACQACVESADARDTPMASPTQVCVTEVNDATTSPVANGSDDKSEPVKSDNARSEGESQSVPTPSHVSTSAVVRKDETSTGNKLHCDEAGMSPEVDIRKALPRVYEHCKAQDLGVLIADMLVALMKVNDAVPLDESRLTRFHSRAPPGISCHDYIQRLIHHATLLPAILLAMVLYVDRLCSHYPAFNVSSLTVHRFLISAATVASKGLSDAFWTNSTYARIGGISTTELAMLELDFLQRIQFQIVPTTELLHEYYVHLVETSKTYRFETVEVREDNIGMTENELMQTKR